MSDTKDLEVSGAVAEEKPVAPVAEEEVVVEKVEETKVEEKKEETKEEEEKEEKREEKEEKKEEKKESESKSKIVSDPSVLPVTSDHGLILKQVEFYFSDQNLPRDKFLWKTTSANDGWVPISTIANFARMRRFQPFEEVVAALRESKELLEVDEEGTKVRRKVPISAPAPEEKKQTDLKSLYVEGFGEETPTSQFDIESLFEKASGPVVKQVRLLRDFSKKFVGSVFVEFASAEDAKSFAESNPELEFNEKKLKVMPKEEFLAANGGKVGFGFGKFDAFRTEKRKRNENGEDGEGAGEEDGEKREKKRGGRGGRGGRGRGRGGRGRGRR